MTDKKENLHSPPSEGPNTASTIHHEHLYNAEMFLEHFGEIPWAFSDALIDSVHDAARDVVGELEHKLIGLPKSQREDVLFSFETLLISHLDNIWEEFEGYYKSAIVHVPEGMYLPLSGNKTPPEGVTRETITQMQNELNETRFQLSKVNYVRAKLKENTPQIDVAIQKMKEELKKMDDIEAMYANIKDPMAVQQEYEKNIQLHQQLQSKLKAASNRVPKTPPSHWHWVASEISRAIVTDDSVEPGLIQELVGTKINTNP